MGLLFSETLAYAFADPYALGFFQGLATAAEEAGVGLLILPLPRGEKRPPPVRDAVVDAFCVVSLPDGHPALAEVLARRLPTVVVDEPYVPGHPFLGIDELAAGAQAARHLAELGHRRVGVAMVGLHDDGRTGWADPGRQRGAVFEAMRGRRSGYEAACVSAGVDWASVPFYELSRNSRAAEQGGRPRAARAHAAADGHPDQHRRAGARHPRRRRRPGARRPPRDLSVVGFSDSAAEEAGLTTIRQAKQEIGAAAGRLLLEPPDEPERLLFPHELIVRASTAPPRP
ncbi:substrate-binding domain-containing protein [Nonomuraea ferruginea]